MRSRILTLIFIIGASLTVQGQVIKKDSTLIQFSGVFLDADSLTPVPWVNIVVINRKKGTTTDYRGAFSFVAHQGDTIQFTCVGYKPFQCTIPDTLSTKRYTLVQLFSRDTYNLPEAVIFPWPSKEDFREAFLELYIPDDDMERARNNLEQAKLRDKITGIPNWGSINYKQSNQMYMERMYYAGQAPPMTIFNPFAWAEFFRALKSGDLKDPNKEEQD
ncbi:MAG: carboxypeptidase-like regulatory domain-containing protein [Salibacteraceae bacterium]|nr:carboxypeptidase-like regulatory domain-containing protein [Salibacteraceae bacterium]